MTSRPQAMTLDRVLAAFARATAVRVLDRARESVPGARPVLGPAARSARAGESAPRTSIVTRVRARLMLVALESLAIGVPFGLLAFHLWGLRSAPMIYSDSGTVLSISRTLAGGDLGPLIETQSPPLQDGVYALLLAWSLDGLVHLPVLAASFALALMLGLVVYRLTGVLASAALPCLVLLCSPVFWTQASQLPFYAVFALLGYAGLYLCVEFIVRGGSPWRAWLGAVLAGLSIYAFTLALIFFIVPAAASVFFAGRAQLRRAVLVHVPLILVVAPWVVWHLAEGGVAHFHHHPLNWFNVKYAPMIVPAFWGNGLDTTLPEYAGITWDVFATRVIDWRLMLFLPPGFVALQRRLGTRSALFAAALLLLHLAVLIATRPSTHARYHYPILPLLVLLISGGAYWTICWCARLIKDASEGLSSPLRTLTAIAAAGAALTFIVLPPAVPSDTKAYYVERLDRDRSYTDLRLMAHRISQSDGGLIARDSAIQQLVPDNQVFTTFLLSEEDYVTYLSWLDDGAVVDVFERHGIEWVMLRNNVLRWERDYNAWLFPAYGRRPQHYLKIQESEAFELVYAGAIYRLYRLGGDVPKAGVARGWE